MKYIEFYNRLGLKDFLPWKYFWLTGKTKTSLFIWFISVIEVKFQSPGGCASFAFCCWLCSQLLLCSWGRVCGLWCFDIVCLDGWGESSKQTKSKEKPLHFFSGLKCAGTQVTAGGDRRAHGQYIQTAHLKRMQSSVTIAYYFLGSTQKDKP